MDRLDTRLRNTVGIDRRSVVLGVYPESKRLARAKRVRAPLGDRRKKVRAPLGDRRKKVRVPRLPPACRPPCRPLQDGAGRAGTGRDGQGLGARQNKER